MTSSEMGVARLAFAAWVAVLAVAGESGVALAARYRAEPMAGVGSVARLRADLGEDRFLDVLKVNRIDPAHASRTDSLIVPEEGPTLLDLAPFPATLQGLDSTAKLLLVAVRIQAFAAYEYGRLVRWGPVCTGRSSTPTAPGYFRANWKARHHVSSVDSSWIMPYTVNIEPRIGTALHQYALPGLPSSHCCIRLLEDDARWVFEWVDVAAGRAAGGEGTGVVVFGAYEFEAPRPWRRLPVDPDATRLWPEEIASALERVPDASIR